MSVIGIRNFFVVEIICTQSRRRIKLRVAKGRFVIDNHTQLRTLICPCNAKAWLKTLLRIFCLKLGAHSCTDNSWFHFFFWSKEAVHNIDCLTLLDKHLGPEIPENLIVSDPFISWLAITIYPPFESGFGVLLYETVFNCTVCIV